MTRDTSNSKHLKPLEMCLIRIIAQAQQETKVRHHLLFNYLKFPPMKDGLNWGGGKKEIQMS